MTDKCPRCEKAVYFAEEVFALGKKYHKTCLKCCNVNCSKRLESTNVNDHEGDLYCNNCYRKLFGPHGYGFAAGAAGLAADGTRQANGTSYQVKVPTIAGGVGGANMCPRCGKAVYFAEEKLALGKKFHKMCLKCSSCNKPLDSTNCNDHEGELFCNTCHRKNFGPKGYGFAGGAAGLASEDNPDGDSRNVPAFAQAQALSGATYGGGDHCPRCGKTVYAAEKIIGGGKTYHKLCFRCSLCNKGLDSTSLCERDNDIFCRACYSKNFGPKGYGYAMGAAGLSMDTGNPGEITRENVPHTPTLEDGMENGDGERCTICLKSVFFAERLQAAGKLYHKNCFRCNACQKTLDSVTLCERDSEIFCKACYGKYFGPKGFGYGSALQHTG